MSSLPVSNPPIKVPTTPASTSREPTRSAPGVQPASLPAASTVFEQSAPRAATALPSEDSGSFQALLQATTARAPRFEQPALHRVEVPLLEWNLTPDQIAARLATAKAECDQKLAALLAVPDSERTFDNTLLALEQATYDFGDVTNRLGFLQQIHTDKAVRDASAAADEEASKYFVELSARRDIYRAVKAWFDGPGKTEALDAGQQRLVDETMRGFRRSGLELPDAQLQRLVAINSRLAELSTQFSKNLAENGDKVEVTQAQLAGLPEDFKARLEKTEQGALVPTKASTYLQFMENCKDPEARKKLYLAYNSREASENLPLLQEAVKLRKEAAALLGYATHTDYVTEERMAKNAATVKGFLDDLQSKLRPRLEADKARMTELKRAELGDPAARLQPWDSAYYLDKMRKKDYALDTEEVKKYFPAETVFEGMRKFFGDLYGIDVEPVKDASLWHPAAQLYEVRDRDSGELMGRLYTDLFMRKEGKYGHAALFGIGYARQVGEEYRTPLSAIVCNFDEPANGQPSLLTHDQVTTLFHEFGHAMHSVLTEARFPSQAGTAVPRDFVEVPSQFQENFAFEPSVLEKISGHFADPSKKLPADLVKKLKEARTFDAGWHYMRQIFLAQFDQALHTSDGSIDVNQADKELFRTILGMEQPANTTFPATFGHMFGYDGGYYSYLWSEVFCHDLYSKFAEAGVFDQELGEAYRDTILAAGRSEDPDKLLRDFLQREPSNAAFLALLGIGEK